MTAAIPEVCLCWSCLLLLQREAGLTDVEIIARVERRRKWTAQEKAALVAEVEAEGGKVTVVARRHRIAESVLYNWRAAWKAAAAAMPGPTAPMFMPLGLLGGSDHREPARPMRANDSGVGGIEIVLPNGTRLSVDASVNEKALSRVLRAMKEAT
jgi:transposase